MDPSCNKHYSFVFPHFEVGYRQHIHIVSARRFGQSLSFVDGTIFCWIGEFQQVAIQHTESVRWTMRKVDDIVLI